jgi:hypothetical protein
VLAADTVTKVAALVEREYFDAPKPAAVAAGRDGRSATGYATAATPEALAALLTADLRAATNDQHLGGSCTLAPARTISLSND